MSFCDICSNKGNMEICVNCVLDVDDRASIPSHFVNKPTLSVTATMNDSVNHPNHYQSKSGLETIQVIEAFTEDLTGIEAVYTGNVIKYICRWDKKNGLQDLKKAQWYLNHLIEKVEEKESK